MEVIQQHRLRMSRNTMRLTRRGRRKETLPGLLMVNLQPPVFCMAMSQYPCYSTNSFCFAPKQNRWSVLQKQIWSWHSKINFNEPERNDSRAIEDKHLHIPFSSNPLPLTLSSQFFEFLGGEQFLVWKEWPPTWWSWQSISQSLLTAGATSGWWRPHCLIVFFTVEDRAINPAWQILLLGDSDHFKRRMRWLNFGNWRLNRLFLSIPASPPPLSAPLRPLSSPHIDTWNFGPPFYRTSTVLTSFRESIRLEESLTYKKWHFQIFRKKRVILVQKRFFKWNIKWIL